MDDLIISLQSLPPLLVYGVVFAVAFIENLFPPSPSDVLIVFAGSLVSIGSAGFVLTLTAATLGSTAGFLVMFGIGFWFGRRIVDEKKIRFLPYDAIQKVDAWFEKYGYWLIVGNRFLSGTRAVVAFFAGMSGLRLALTAGLCLLSALVWNSLLMVAGYTLGNNWRDIGFYLSTYAQVVTGIVIVVVIIVIIRLLSGGSRSRTP